MSSREWRDGILAATTAELVANNGAEFLAFLLQRAVQEQRVLIQDHAEQLERYRRANWAGLAIYHHVLDLHRKDHKSAWVHDLMQIHDTEMSKR